MRLKTNIELLEASAECGTATASICGDNENCIIRIYITDRLLFSMETFTISMTLYPPKVQRKAQAKIDHVVGNSRLLDCSDIDELLLVYVNLILEEVYAGTLLLRLEYLLSPCTRKTS